MSSRRKFNVDAGTLEKQSIASDPLNTVWVSANAGSGKTHVLSQRVIRLLLQGVPPSRILCLTYTKTAAAEMENRVFERLATWTVLDDEKLGAAIEEIEGRKPGAALLGRARILFANALESPGGLQIQTIHAFCTAVLQRFPLEANIAGHFDLLDDETGLFLRAEAIRKVIRQAADGSSKAIADAFDKAFDQGGEFALNELFKAAFEGATRSALSDFLDARAANVLGEHAVYRAAGLEPGATPVSTAAAMWPMKSMTIADMQSLIRVAPSAKGKTMPPFGNDLDAILHEPHPVRRLNLLSALFLTKDGANRSAKRLSGEPFMSAVGDFESAFYSACDEIRAALDAINRLDMVQASLAAHTLLAAARDEYRDLKRARGMLDYDDLIEATRALLTRSSGAAWVQYKLDQGIKHVLVDEAQDTSPRQWDIINALTGDFFAGETAASQERTLFVVGDEKQSIYSFQGAQPEVFAETGRQKQTLVRAADRRFEPVTLPLSFRSVPEVLAATDLVFEPLRGTGRFSGTETIVHQALRHDAHGRVEVWPRILKDKSDAEQIALESDWTKAVDHLRAPAVVLAREIAGTIKAMIASETNPARGNPVLAGDILVLVRRRDAFMHALARELKDRDVPVAGADRLVLTGHIAVLDLLALARTVLQPDDDLSLAALLKSPVFNFTDDDLIQLSAGRDDGESLIQRVRQAAAVDQRMARTLEQLNRWRAEADYAPVYEFFARVMGRDRVRAKLVGRFGGEAADVLDEFMSFALESERAGVHGLQAFVETITATAPQIKRELSGGRGDVRIMTVHGAKGLEAKYVFLIDPGSAPAITQHAPKLFPVPSGGNGGLPDVFFWAPGKELSNSVTANGKAKAMGLAAAEYLRQLYVGMTRAEDVLIVCGYGGANEPEGTWLGTVWQALSGSEHTVKTVHPVTGRPCLTFRLGETKNTDREEVPDAASRPGPVPDFLSRPAPAPDMPPRPLTPSGTGLAVEDDASAQVRSPVLEVDDLPSLAIRKGAAVHRLLEVLPQLEPDARAAAAATYLERTFPDGQLSHATILSAVFAILDNPHFSLLFAPGSQAEVSVGGEVMIRGEKRVISGKIDRIAVADGKVLIADYKTSRPVPQALADVPQSHAMQLALYAEVLRQVYPGHKISAALVYTEGPHLIELDTAGLKAALEALT
jgi:ATP-dependent helicase/nuclease subunit A